MTEIVDNYLELGTIPETATPPPNGHGPDRFPFTDVGNAQRLVAKHGKDLRYCPAWKKWLIWDGKRWRIDDTGAVETLAKRVILDLYHQAPNIQDTGTKADAAKHALKSQYEGRIRAMVRLAETEPGVPIRPEQLDSNPYQFNCHNGTLNLKTGKLNKHRPDDLITKLSPVEYDGAAKCPIFDAFLNKIMGGNQDLVGYLRRIIGYALTGDVKEKAIFFLYGEGNNGKTTFLEIIRDIMGEYAGQIPISSLMSKGNEGIPNDIARLKGLRFVTSSEAEQGRKLAEAKVKLLTGMGKLQARYLYGEYFEFTPTFKIFMDANHKPEIRGTDPAIWSRLKLIPFSITIRPEDIDKDLKDKLRRELPGILAWAVRGCGEWQDNHDLREPKAVADATNAYRDEMDSVGDFLNDECVLGNTYKTAFSVLYGAYKKWSSERSEEPVSPRQFGQELTRRELKEIRIAGDRGRQGITLKNSTGHRFEE